MYMLQYTSRKKKTEYLEIQCTVHFTNISLIVLHCIVKVDKTILNKNILIKPNLHPYPYVSTPLVDSA